MGYVEVKWIRISGLIPDKLFNTYHLIITE